MRKLLAFCFIFGFTLLTSCSKTEDVPPTGKILGQVLHHDDPILGATVYIKFNATEFPGISPDLYDNQVTASLEDATFEFSELQQGAYYLFALGEDTDCSCTVLGGIPIVLNSNSEIKESIVPVTE